ncbi:hypothetical protein ACJMK2_032308 [Sinanodonta woodiana]|uniref:Spt20-like SEP domain-containing protein n=1 Tax=Sinanodonta woodiana TaxID=1069815 RepID=A0ABD3X2U2_SINWO
MEKIERAVKYAEYLVESAKQNPSRLAANLTTSNVKGKKSIHQRLLEFYLEESGKELEDQHLQSGSHLLPKLVRRDKLNCLILKLYPGNEGYSLMLRSKTGIETETAKLPYEVSELLEYVDDCQLPPFLVDILEKAQVNVFYSGCVIVEVRDFRRSTNGSFDTHYVLLKPTPQSLLADIYNLTSDGQSWSQDDQFMLESKLLLATEEPLCLDPSPAVLLVANKMQYERKKLNTTLLTRSVKKFTQAAVNRKRKFAQCAAPKELRLFDFISKKKDRKSVPPINLKLGKPCVDMWKQRPVNLTAPESVDVEKYAKANEKPDVKKDNSMVLFEEQILEREVTQDRNLMAKLTIYHRLWDDSYLGELYLDYDYIQDKSEGATCKFHLGNEDSVNKYLEQFKEIFTEEGRRSVKITKKSPGQAPVVTYTQTIPLISGPMSGVHTLSTKQPAASSTTVTSAVKTEVAPSATITTGMMRNVPLLSLSIAPAGSVNTTSNLVSPQALNTPQGTLISAQSAMVQVQSQLQTQGVQQSPTNPVQAQGQSASQRLRQIGIHTSISRGSTTPSASPVNTQPVYSQVFSSPPAGNYMSGSQPSSVSKVSTPSASPSPIMSPPPSTSTPRKLSTTTESATIHHLAQTPHQSNVATLTLQRDLTGQVSATINSQSAGTVQNINIANITGIPPNINIQNLQGLPGMNIANLSGLQNMQVSLSLPGIAVPISMITTTPVLHQTQAGILVSSLPPNVSAVTTPHGTAGSGTTVTAGSGQGSTSLVTSTTTLVTMCLASVTSAQSQVTNTSGNTQVLTGVSPSSVLTSQTGMLSVPINLTQLVPAGLKQHAQLRTSTTTLPVLQFGQQGIQVLNLQQPRGTLKTTATMQTPQALMGGKSTTTSVAVSGPISTALLGSQNLASQQVAALSHLTVGKQGQAQGGATLNQHVLQLAPGQTQFHLQALQKQQQLQFHQLQLKQQQQQAVSHGLQPVQLQSSLGGKPKSKKRTTPTPPKN